MNLKYIASALVIGVSACGMPGTPCDCHSTITDLNNGFVERELEFRKFDPGNKNDYSDDLQEFKQELSAANEVLLHCKNIYHVQGLCDETGEASLWDSGEGYFLTDLEIFSQAYTGDWRNDSIRIMGYDGHTNPDNSIEMLVYGSVIIDADSFGLRNPTAFPRLWDMDTSAAHIIIDTLPMDSFPQWYKEEVESMK